MIKDSRIKWIENIPEHWYITKLKYLLEENCDNFKVGPFGSSLSGDDYKDEGYWVYNQRCVLDNNFETNDTFVDEYKYKELKGFVVHSNDILITTRGTIGKVAIVPENCPKGILHPCIIRFVVNQNLIDNRLVELIFNNSNIVTDQILMKSNATTIDVIYSYTLKDLLLPVIPGNEQKRLIAFLGRKCAEIDDVLCSLKKQIDILNEYKKSLITETVTKGLNPNVSMKDSGVEWIGRVPSHWEICRIKDKYEIITGFTPDTMRDDYYDDSCGNTWISIADMDENKVIYESKSKISTFYIRSKHPEIVKKGSLLYSFKLSVGKVGFAGNDLYTNEAIASFQNSDDVVLPFLYYASYLIEYNSNINIYGAKILNQELIKNSITVFPPIDEQKQISDYLDNKVETINEIIFDKLTQITKLKEYKQSLIFEYVTGKKRVKEAI